MCLGNTDLLLVKSCWLVAQGGTHLQKMAEPTAGEAPIRGAGNLEESPASLPQPLPWPKFQKTPRLVYRTGIFGAMFCTQHIFTTSEEARAKAVLLMMPTSLLLFFPLVPIDTCHLVLGKENYFFVLAFCFSPYLFWQLLASSKLSGTTCKCCSGFHRGTVVS